MLKVDFFFKYTYKIKIGVPINKREWINEERKGSKRREEKERGGEIGG